MTALATDLERTRRVQECLFRIFEILARPASLEEHLAAIHAELYDVLDASNLYVAMYDPTSELYVFPYNADEDDDDYTPQHLRKSLTDYVRRSAEPLLCNEAVHHVLCKAGEVDLVGEPSPVWMGAPMVTERGAIGVVVVQSFTDPDAYGPPTSTPSPSSPAAWPTRWRGRGADVASRPSTRCGCRSSSTPGTRPSPPAPPRAPSWR